MKCREVKDIFDRMMNRPGFPVWILPVLLGAIVFLGGFGRESSPYGGLVDSIPASLSRDIREVDQIVVSDTSNRSVVDSKACTRYRWFREHKISKWEEASFPVGRHGHKESLHELTCRWVASQHALSLDSTRLPKYVRPVGDSIRLSGDALAYPVKMVQLQQKPVADANILYYVAEVGDSLYYREIEEARPKDFDPSKVSVRSHRLLDVAETKSKYIWFEYAKSQQSDDSGTPTSIEEWKAHVFSYDKSRGMRHLAFTAIRREVRKNGKFHGARQLDVSIPEAGLMDVEERLQKGAKVTRGMAWHRFLGRHVIDTTVVSNLPPPPPSE